MHFNKLALGLLTAASMAIPSVALADDWTATKLRGAVLHLVNGEWAKLQRGEVVSDDRVIRTLTRGRVTFQRGRETIEMGAETQIRIVDKSGKKYTTVLEDFGEVSIEAEVRNVAHFEVRTPQMAAVVKGTRFVVTSYGTLSEVKVTRGRVAVQDGDTRQTTLLSVGQSASTADRGVPLIVSGQGALPIVYQKNGVPVDINSIPKGADGRPLTETQIKKLIKEMAKAEEKTAEAAAKAGDKASEAATAEKVRQAAFAAGMSLKEAEKAAKEAVKDVKDAAKDAEKAATEATKASEEAAKDVKEAAKDAEKASKEEVKSAEKEAKEASKVSEEAVKDAKKQ